MAAMYGMLRLQEIGASAEIHDWCRRAKGDEGWQNQVSYGALRMQARSCFSLLLVPQAFIALR